MASLLILGSSGFIGSSLSRRLAGDGPIGFDMIPGTHTQEMGQVSEIKQEWWQKNIAPEATIIFAAGRSDVWGSTDEPQKDYDAYNKALIRVLNLLSGSQRLLLFSSAAVYSGLSCPKDGFDESSPLKSASVYGSHRILAESLVSLRHAKQEGSQWSYDILRPFSVFGAQQRKQVIFDLSQKVLQSSTRLEVTGSAGAQRDFVHIDFLCGVVEELLDGKATNSSLNVCTGEATRIEDLAKLIVELAGKSLEISFDGQKRAPLDLYGNPKQLWGHLPGAKSFDTKAEMRKVILSYLG